MKLPSLVKHKLILMVLYTQLAALSLFPFIQKAGAATYDSGGFIIQADRVVGENMMATLIAGKAAGGKTEPMLRITYDSVQIYGMRLTKQFASPGGTVSITMKADGPVYIKGVQMDTTAISFNGACMNAEKLVPRAALENVTMVAHSMDADYSSLDKLKLQTINGDGGVQKPGKLKILGDLASMPSEQMKKEIENINTGHMPLTCDGEPEKEGLAAAPPADIIEVVAKPLEPVQSITEPIEKNKKDITDPIDDITNDITNDIDETVKKVDKKVVQPILKEVEKKTDPVKEIVKNTTQTAKTEVIDPVKATVDETEKDVCRKLTDANGQITKELGLELVDKALDEDKALNELCPENATLTGQLTKWTEGFLDSLGLLSLLGAAPSEEEQLRKIHDALLKEPDGKVITFD